jgi:imidazolonepropionase-like amidohydrolase
MGTDGINASHLPTELSLMVEHGLSPIGALRAATIEGARLLRVEADVGTLEVGKMADLVVLDFDPLAEPEGWREPTRVAMVIQAGHVFVDRR